MKKHLPNIYFLILVGITSCQQEQPAPTPNETIEHFASIIVKVYDCNTQNDPFCENPSPIADAQVKVFKTEEDLLFGEPILHEKQVDQAGMAAFHLLERGKYYWFVINSPSYGLKTDVENTPTNGIAYLDVVY